MYNKEISEKMLSDAFDMKGNIKNSRSVCFDIYDRAKRQSESSHAKIYGNELSNLYALWESIKGLYDKAYDILEQMIDINGGVKGYDTETYICLINLYEELVKDNMKVNVTRNELREKYGKVLIME